MKKHIITCLASLLAVSSFAQNGTYRLTVKLGAAKTTSRAYLVSQFGWSNNKTIDSATFQNGSFIFKGKVGDPLKVSLVIDYDGSAGTKWTRNSDALPLYLEPGQILIQSRDSAKNAQVTGSPLNAEYGLYKQIVLALGESVAAQVNQKYAIASAEEKKEKTFTDGLMEQIKAASKKTDSLKSIYINHHPNSFLSLYALTELSAGGQDLTKTEKTFNTLSSRLRESETGDEFAKRFDHTGPTAIGAIAIDFAEPDTAGKMVRLSDFRGKYVLLDFWASWCGPCRAENPNVRKAYQLYKGKNFTVLGVSLDQPGKKSAWLAAIKADQLPWTQVSDLQSWNNAAAKAYGIRAIPQNFLIGPDGKILAKNLRGDALTEKLAELLK